MDDQDAVIVPDIAASVKEEIERQISPVIEGLKAAMNPPAMVALRPPHIQIPAPPPPIAQVPPARPMLPPPPQVQVPPNRQHIAPAMQIQQRPETQYARELREKAAGLHRPRLCDGCGGTKRINEKKDKRGQIVGFEPCPKCVEMEQLDA